MTQVLCTRPHQTETNRGSEAGLSAWATVEVAWIVRQGWTWMPSLSSHLIVPPDPTPLSASHAALQRSL